MIVGILGPGGCGGTFLDWSLHYLSGHTTNLVVNLDSELRETVLGQTVQTVVYNPLQHNTSHKHQKTHPNNLSLEKIISIFQKNNCYDLHTFYYVESMSTDQTSSAHNNIVNSYPHIHFIDYVFAETDIDIIFCLQYEKIKKAQTNFANIILNQTGKTLVNIPVWDQREILSLYYPGCLRSQTMMEKKHESKNRLLLNFKDAFFKLPHSMVEIFKLIDRSIDRARWNHWLKIYHKWLDSNNIEFFTDLDYIIDCIISNKSISLAKYNMTFAKEVVIASKLLYNHNMALRSHGISMLSDNTLQWSEILEKNIYHTLNKD